MICGGAPVTSTVLLLSSCKCLKGCLTNLIANVGECAHDQTPTPENEFQQFLRQNVATIQSFHIVQELCNFIFKMYEMNKMPEWIAELVIRRLRMF